MTVVHQAECIAPPPLRTALRIFSADQLRRLAADRQATLAARVGAGAAGEGTFTFATKPSKKTGGQRQAVTLTRTMVMQYSSLTRVEAATALGVSKSALEQACIALGINWGHSSKTGNGRKQGFGGGKETRWSKLPPDRIVRDLVTERIVHHVTSSNVLQCGTRRRADDPLKYRCPGIDGTPPAPRPLPYRAALSRVPRRRSSVSVSFTRASLSVCYSMGPGV